MSVVWLKLYNDEKSFKLLENLGFNVYKIYKDENIDFKIDELIRKDNNTIVLTNEVASFSNKINNEYKKNKKIKIIIDKNHFK